MRKIIGFLSITVFAVAMLFNANGFSDANNDTSLASLIVMNTANAEWGNDTDCDKDPNDTCWNAETGVSIPNCDPSSFWDTCGDI